MKVLIADDDAQLVRALSVTLSARGYDVVTARDGREAIDAVITERPDLVLLDLGMPRLDGIGVLEGVRAWSQVPVLVLSGRTDSSDKVDALDAGADDYVTKPFQMDELLARLRALGRRRVVASEETPTIAIGPLLVDLVAKQVTPAEGPAIRLTPTEWRLLEVLVTNPDRLMTREMLLTEVWGPTHGNDSGYLRLYMAQLRRKLEPDPAHPRYLVTESGMGYRFAPGA
ncbi:MULTISPECIES: response regulator [Curtobacterium]|jgi:two-component system KDP operon response regulator KdpE|uniref:response regulator n=1 Tax=Curtobacterium TaxID=2034 RepID=UPI0004828A5A|nr:MULTISPECIES: response regulator [Curtobacterium]MBF4626626.1 response regulator [Curtobacterium flaccumfaciens]MBO9042857.1 response regulator [Curtobacterium flaccumfaciens pv. flaccumfaciens]MBO9046214.1 response regulator [Curtobacterium flaccumfaciens pv. flaccumfaciens]MBO9051125.1 response regulator [Curtobacterium flaccumfaciens pv. flaccumfaciens]MBO9058550.1 response regulator [Curtobacterium flaccumfaciens pv. flaccumfaciens]